MTEDVHERSEARIKANRAIYERERRAYRQERVDEAARNWEETRRLFYMEYILPLMDRLRDIAIIDPALIMSGNPMDPAEVYDVVEDPYDVVERFEAERKRILRR